MRTVFIGTPAFLGRIDGETRCAFWIDEPVDHDFDPARLIHVDLARCPSAAAAKEIEWDAVEVDDCFAGPGGAVSGTTIGPAWPELRLAGAVYLARDVAAALPVPLRPPCPPVGVAGRDYECLAAVYWTDRDDPRAGNRYVGHHAEIIAERGPLVHVAVYPPGSSLAPHTRPVRMWIDLDSADQCDTGPESLTTIGAGPGPKAGALFLICGQVTA